MDDLPFFRPDDFRLLFLDIDGVLNSTKTAVAYGCLPWPSSVIEGNRAEPADPPVEDVEAFDDVSVRLIERLCEKTDTHIVLSSTWRSGLNVEEVRAMLGYIGLSSERVIGRTGPSLPGRGRGWEIEQFLIGLERDTKYLVESGLIVPGLYGKSPEPRSYVIVDDDDDMLESQVKNFVQVNWDEGLSFADVLKAGQILTMKDFMRYNLM